MGKLIALVTGSTTGIGRQTALDLAQRGLRVLVHGRTSVRGEPVVEELRGLSGNPDIDLVTGDLSSMDEVLSLAERVLERVPHLDVLINNAAVFMKPRVLTPDGFETTFATNHLAPFLLTGLLQEGMMRPGGRILNVASMAHEGALLDFDNFQGERHYDGFGAYALSKLANVLFTVELAERLQGTGVTANCLHPGVVSTRLLSQGFGISGIPVERSTGGLLHLALSPQVEGVSGQYFVDCRPAPMTPLAREQGIRGALWAHSESLVGGFRARRRSVPPGR